MPSSFPSAGPVSIPQTRPRWTRAGAGLALVVCDYHASGGSNAILSPPQSRGRLIAMPHAPFRVMRGNLPDISGHVAVGHAGRRRLLGLSVAVVLGLGDAARRLAQALRSPSIDDESELLRTLTEREREILKLFAGGLSYQEIGEIRNNSALTVRNAVSGVQRKLGFRTRQQMVVRAVRTGLVDGGSE